MNLDDLRFGNTFNNTSFNYEFSPNDDDTVADAIYNHLFKLNKTIEVENKGDILPEIEKFYKEKLTLQVTKGAPIDVFLTTFSPKFKHEEQTNFHIHPDMSDLFTFIHLQRIAKSVRELYPYNFRFFVVYKGDLYKNLGMWTDEEIKKNFDYLLKLNKEAEKITKVRNSILLVRWDEFIGRGAQIFKDSLYEKANDYYDKWKDKVEPDYTQIEKWKNDFGKHNHSKHKDPFFREFFTKEACKVKALNNLVFKDGELLDVILEDNPNLLLAHTNSDTKYFSIDLNPSFRSNSHSYLTVYDGNHWYFEEWSMITTKYKNYKPIYFDGFDHPLYFEVER